MKQLKTKQGGFRAVKIIIIYFVVIAIGTAGFLVYKKSSGTKNAATPTAAEQSKTGIDDN
jgi:hypothetical protein